MIFTSSYDVLASAERTRPTPTLASPCQGEGWERVAGTRTLQNGKRQPWGFEGSPTRLALLAALLAAMRFLCVHQSRTNLEALREPGFDPVLYLPAIIPYHTKMTEG